MIKVSVIVPVYNVAKYLPECMESLISQTLKEIEIICVNDGSTDNSLEILEKYRQKDNRIKIISQENKGLSEARNAAIREVSGEYIAMVDSDDWLEPDMLEKLYQKAIEKNTDIVECDFFEHRELALDSLKVRKLKPKAGFFTNLKIRSGIPYNWHDIQKEILFLRAYVWNRIYKTDLVKNRILFEGRVGEDYYFVVEAYLKAKSIVYYNKPFYHYRKREASLSSSTQKLENFEMSEKFLYKGCKRIEDIIKRCNLTDELKKEFQEFITWRLWLVHQAVSLDVRRVFGEMLDEATFIRLEKIIQNKNKSFWQTIFNISTSMVAGMTFKKITFLGYVFLIKISK